MTTPLPPDDTPAAPGEEDDDTGDGPVAAASSVGGEDVAAEPPTDPQIELPDLVEEAPEEPDADPLVAVPEHTDDVPEVPDGTAGPPAEWPTPDPWPETPDPTNEASAEPPTDRRIETPVLAEEPVPEPPAAATVDVPDPARGFPAEPPAAPPAPGPGVPAAAGPPPPTAPPAPAPARGGWRDAARRHPSLVLLSGATALGLVLGAAAFAAARTLAPSPDDAAPVATEQETTPSPSPTEDVDPDVAAAQEALTETLDLVLAAQSFTAREETTNEDGPDVTTEHRLANDPDSLYVRQDLTGDPALTHVRYPDGTLLERPDGSEDWVRDPQDADPDLGDYYATVSAEGFWDPLRAMAAADDLEVTEEGDGELLFEGNIERVAYPDGAEGSGQAVELPAYFQIRIGTDGYPVRVYYGGRPYETRIEYTDFDAPVDAGAVAASLPDDPGDVDAVG